jgi:hypothetical protein
MKREGKKEREKEKHQDNYRNYCGELLDCTPLPLLL